MLDFDQLNVTIMVAIVELSGQIDVNSIFPLLDITRVPIVESKRRLKKPKIPTCDIKGAIVSARFKGVCRGVARESYFRNMIQIDISNGVKNINIKLGRNTMHICGTKSLDEAREAAEMLLAKIYEVDQLISQFKADPSHYDQICNLVKGQPVIINGYLRHSIRVPSTEDRLMTYLVGLATDFEYYEDFLIQLDWIRQLDQLIDQPQVNQLSTAMINYSYNLDFTIDRLALAEAINGLNGFVARYDNTVQHNVTVILPYDDPAKTKKKCRHCFIVYRSGFVTQSGPDRDRMRQAYNLFRQTIEQIRPIIENPRKQVTEA